MPIVIQNYRGFVPQEEKANGFETAGDKAHFFFPLFFGRWFFFSFLPPYQFFDEVITNWGPE